MRSATQLEGTVAAFDADRGLGTVIDADGVEYEFHCVEIADGSRDVPVGASVTFERLAKFGRYEAAGIVVRSDG